MTIRMLKLSFSLQPTLQSFEKTNHLVPGLLFYCKGRMTYAESIDRGELWVMHCSNILAPDIKLSLWIPGIFSASFFSHLFNPDRSSPLAERSKTHVACRFTFRLGEFFRVRGGERPVAETSEPYFLDSKSNNSERRFPWSLCKDSWRLSCRTPERGSIG